MIGRDQERTTFEKLHLWTVCLWSFFGSFRLGELLSQHKKTFDPHTHLLWKDVKVRSNDDIWVTLKSPKVAKPAGDTVILFQFPDLQMCPVKIFQEYEREAARKGLKDSSKPIFRNEPGTAWAKYESQTELNRLVAMTGVLEDDEKLFATVSGR